MLRAHFQRVTRLLRPSRQVTLPSAEAFGILLLKETRGWTELESDKHWIDAARLTGADLDFIVRIVAADRKDPENVKAAVKGKPDILGLMLDDPRLFAALMEKETWVMVSPYLFFTVLLRQARRDLPGHPFTMERLSATERVPVFDAPRVLRLLDNSAVMDYLAGMLASFSRVESMTIYYRWRGRLRRRRFSDMDIDDLSRLSENADPQSLPALHRRIADIALFMVGVFPEYVARPSPVSAAGSLRRKPRTLEDYHEEGKRHYGLAARMEGEEPTRSVLQLLSTDFELAKKPLNLLAERYIPFTRYQIFNTPP